MVWVLISEGIERMLVAALVASEIMSLDEDVVAAVVLETALSSVVLPDAAVLRLPEVVIVGSPNIVSAIPVAVVAVSTAAIVVVGRANEVKDEAGLDLSRPVVSLKLKTAPGIDTVAVKFVENELVSRDSKDVASPSVVAVVVPFVEGESAPAVAFSVAFLGASNLAPSANFCSSREDVTVSFCKNGVNGKVDWGVSTAGLSFITSEMESVATVIFVTVTIVCVDTSVLTSMTSLSSFVLTLIIESLVKLLSVTSVNAVMWCGLDRCPLSVLPPIDADASSPSALRDIVVGDIFVTSSLKSFSSTCTGVVFSVITSGLALLDANTVILVTDCNVERHLVAGSSVVTDPTVEWGSPEECSDSEVSLLGWSLSSL
ncbi:unnamed protein product [Nippostrongylus brasiliensis]|uniref:Secreted protein n=1 Tax=Nippostrongylus brasiliensis TaxID=27835 RepID=A0A0N4Y7M1_NIPBR|nr:unnamed protein product [Nippostrongylus brasiliensis]